MKKLLIGVGFLLSAGLMKATTPGITAVTVERYYITNAADSAWAASGSNTNATNYTGNGASLHKNTVAYRVYVTLAPGFSLLNVFGEATNPLSFSTTTDFFNTDDGGIYPSYSSTQLYKKGLGLIDSYITLGAVGSDGAYGILKADQTGSHAINMTSTNGENVLFQNNLAAQGPALTVQDGISSTTGADAAPALLGITGASGQLALLDQGESLGNSFTSTSGSYYLLGGQLGLTSDNNKILIGQFTTNGTFTYAFNLVVKNYTTSASYTYVAGTAGTGEIQFAALGGSVGPFTYPTVAVTAPTAGKNYIAGKSATFTASASEANGGSIASVQFYVDGNAVGSAVTSAPYTSSWTTTAGSHTVTAVATDALGTTTTSSGIAFTAAPPTAPSISLANPASATTIYANKKFYLSATASDIDTTITNVQYYVDGNAYGSPVTTSPYTLLYTPNNAAVGTHAITAKATDGFNLTTTSAAVNLTVAADAAPAVTLTAPTSGNTSWATDAVTFTATATSVDTTIASVQFYVDGNAVGSPITSSPYTYSYTGVAGTHTVTAKSTDGFGVVGTSAGTTITVNALQNPVVAVTAPTAGTIYQPVSQGVTPNVTLTASASSADATISSVQFYVNGTAVGSPITSAPFTYTWASTYNAGTNGVVPVTVVATDSRGNSSTSAAVNITIVNPNASYSIVNQVQPCYNATVNQTVKAITAASNVIGYDLTMKFDSTRLTFDSIRVNNGLIDSLYINTYVTYTAGSGTILISLALNGTAPALTAFNGLGNLFTAVFTKTGNFGPKDQVTFTIPSLQESYYTGVGSKVVQSGTYKSYADSVFDGSLKYWNNAQPINSVGLATNIYGNNALNNNCGAVSTAAVQPNSTGHFAYTINNGYSLVIDRDINNATSVFGVLTGNDAYQIQQVLAGTLAPSALELVAMDVNLDGVVSAGDLSQLNQRIVNKIGEFAQVGYYNNQGQSLNNGPSRDWIFVDSISLKTPAFVSNYSKTHVPSVPTCLPVDGTNLSTCPLFTPETFTGVMVGDADGSWASYASNNVSTTLKQANGLNEAVVFDLGNAVANGSFIDVPVSMVSSNQVNSLDFAFQTNQANLNFQGVQEVVKGAEWLANQDANDNVVRFTSSSLNNYAANTTLFSVRFSSINGSVSASDINNTVALLNGHQVNTVFKGALDMAADLIVNVYPNPAKDQLNIVASQNAVVQLFDLAGKLVASEFVITANQQIQYNTANLAAGVYMLKIANDNFVTTKRIVINN